MKQILIILSLFLVTSCDEKKSHHLFKWELAGGTEWKEFGVENDHDQYIGETKKGKPHGLGILYFIDKDYIIYQGQWKNGVFHGEGKLDLSDLTYDGEFKDGKKHGTGYYIFKLEYRTVGFWSGKFKDGSPHGKGKYTWSKNANVFKGKKILGEFNNSFVEGQVKLDFPDGTKYEGGFKKLQPEKEGTFSSPDGSKFVGTWKNGYRQDGEGIHIYSDGSKYVGEWKKNRRVKGIEYDKNGKDSYIIENGYKKNP
jgi:hypothetical protein